VTKIKKYKYFKLEIVYISKSHAYICVCINYIPTQVVLYSLPELDGAIEPIVLGGLVGGDQIDIDPERVVKLAGRTEFTK